jgi:hypothetical protein
VKLWGILRIDPYDFPTSTLLYSKDSSLSVCKSLLKSWDVYHANGFIYIPLDILSLMTSFLHLFEGLPSYLDVHKLGCDCCVVCVSCLAYWHVILFLSNAKKGRTCIQIKLKQSYWIQLASMARCSNQLNLKKRYEAQLPGDGKSCSIVVFLSIEVVFYVTNSVIS